ncbi:alpha/beta hydrolase [Chishuiella sp.]|uniref:alpha/beta hydrolase n=1 Tax=Chishuiella sp. TaxID=1969467 RepID=UPI0028A90173|nr:alpha/beta hydrolase-fold protein [Chishuiella sp.]
MKNILSVIITFFFSLLHAQTPYTIGETYTIHSNILNEDRIIDVQLPQNYSNQDFAKGKYPVVYVLDGDTNFSLVASLERFSTKFLFRSQPEMIVVGIRNIDRTKDYTPTKSLSKNKDNKLQYETSGGAENFINFIDKELKPFVNKKFRTTDFNILHGHSFGGLFAIYTLLNHTDSFDAYIAIDPSLWWDNKVIFKQAQEEFKIKDFKNKSLYVALAHEKIDAQKDRLEHGSTIRKFCEELLPTTQLYSSWKYYPDYNHGSVPIPSSYDAMVAIFKGIELPIKEIPQNPELLQETYDTFSKKLNHTFVPEESLLIELIKYTQRVNQQDNANKILTYALKLYPDSKQLKTMKY